MIVHTIQIAQHRLVKNTPIEFIDTTVKSGVKLFAPSWHIVLAHKNGTITDQEYTTVYRSMMAESYKNNKEQWLSYCNKSNPVALACYCKAGVFCHRHILKGYFEAVCKHHNIPFQYAGEIGGI